MFLIKALIFAISQPVNAANKTKMANLKDKTGRPVRLNLKNTTVSPFSFLVYLFDHTRQVGLVGQRIRKSPNWIVWRKDFNMVGFTRTHTEAKEERVILDSLTTVD